MENNIKEYLEKFKPEKLELIVRISWCWEKGSSGFSMIENHYKVQARFDQALNVKNGKIIGTEVTFNWIEWLAPKKLFGFKYGYKFKKGNMYRILVRENIPQKDDRFRTYYLEQVLEKDVNEPRLDPFYQFENQFEETVTDLTVLIKKRICGWPIVGAYRNPRATMIASVDYKTNELNQSCGTLTWMEKDTKLKLKFNFDGMSTYHVKVRKSKENDNSYLLVDVLKKVTEERLEHVKEEYLKPVVIKSEFATFTLDRNYNWFEGQVDYFGEEISVYMEAEEGQSTADTQLNKLKEIVRNLEEWDKNVKEFAAKDLLDLANEWREEETEITKEQFIQRIGLPTITIASNGTVEVTFDCDNMFTDHGIVVDIDENGEFKGANIVG